MYNKTFSLKSTPVSVQLHSYTFSLHITQDSILVSLQLNGNTVTLHSAWVGVQLHSYMSYMTVYTSLRMVKQLP